MNLYFTRHAQSTGNVIPKTGGQDPKLTELGRRQAQALGERLSTFSFDFIIASPLIRTLETANAVASRQPNGPAPVELLPDLMECGTPADFIPLPIDEARQFCPTALPFSVPTPAGGGASLPEEFHDPANYLARAYRIIGYLRRRFTGDENVLIVTHGSFLTYLMNAALSSASPGIAHYSHDNTGLSFVRYDTENDRPRTVLGFLNDLSHLYRANLTEGVSPTHAL